MLFYVGMEKLIRDPGLQGGMDYDVSSQSYPSECWLARFTFCTERNSYVTLHYSQTSITTFWSQIAVYSF